MTMSTERAAAAAAESLVSVLPCPCFFLGHTPSPPVERRPGGRGASERDKTAERSVTLSVPARLRGCEAQPRVWYLGAKSPPFFSCPATILKWHV